MKSVHISESAICDLITNLEDQLEVHDVLLESLQSERSLTASCSLTDLNEIHSVRDSATNRIFELESERLKIINKIKNEQDSKSNVSLKEIIENSTGGSRNTLIQLRQSLLKTIQSIRNVGEENAETAMARIACFNEVQGAIDKSLKSVSTYSGTGLIKKSARASFLNKSI